MPLRIPPLRTPPLRTLPLLLRFICAHGCNSLSAGIQLVLVAWLAVAVLRLPASQVGWVQCAALVPNVLLLLWVGAVVDRSNPARLLVIANAGLALVHGMFYLLCLGKGPDLFSLIVYAAALGSFNALVQNAREVLVGRLAVSGTLQKTVSRVTFVQFSAQAFGVFLAGFTDLLGVPNVILLQLCLCLGALVFYSGFGGQVCSAGDSGPGFLSALGRLMRIKNFVLVLVVIGFNGFMHLGMFVVLLPLLSTNSLGFDSFAYGLLQLSFVAGAMAVSAGLVRGARTKNPGQHVLFALLYSGLIGFALWAGPTTFGLYALIFLWGGVAASSANHSRVIVQSLTPEAMRGRAMALYQMALFGTAPFGALLAGYLVQEGGTALPLKIIGSTSVALFAVLFFYPKLWAYEPPG